MRTDVAAPADPKLLRQLLNYEITTHRGPEPARAYAVIDAAQDEQFALSIPRTFKLPMSSLFEGRAAAAMTTVAPYLVPFDPAHEFVDHWCERWGTNLGILLISAAAPVDLLKHLRHIFVVQDEGGQEYFFRFYDPRVIVPFIPSCTPQEFIEFIGPCHAMLAESEEGSVSVYRRLGKSERYGIGGS